MAPIAVRLQGNILLQSLVYIKLPFIFSTSLWLNWQLFNLSVIKHQKNSRDSIQLPKCHLVPFEML